MIFYGVIKFPSIENVFFMVHREAQLQITMLGSGTKIGESTIAFASKNTALVSRPPGFGSSTVPPCRLTSAKKKKTNKLRCDHYGEKRHTIDTYWALHGVPDWEKEQSLQVTLARLFVPMIPAIQVGLLIQKLLTSALFSTTIPPHRDHVLTANNAVAPVTGASSILLTLAIPSLDKVLLVPSLSSNLLSVPQVSEQLNCVVLMYPSFVLLQDIQTRGIFGRGTKNGGLYYVDDVATSRVLHAGSAETS
ncbi:hypothetical protein L3X38_027824 [Prunus dulcis]|uniref:Uncharacterized protein n=1 Tax=Prunus dulcis TaxID=3755 RepID=A0AAD4VR96_PRUDU|nr:hypothetical protein L3X38_027824 [Prunus dulcis]